MARGRRPGEFELIERYFRPLASDPGAFALADDAAMMRPKAGEDLVVTTDFLGAGVHFFADDAPESIARKALRVNLSDLAAKGAEPVGYLLALALWGYAIWTVRPDWVALLALVPAALHLANQALRADPADPDLALKLFRSNRTCGLLVFLGMLAVGLATR